MMAVEVVVEVAVDGMSEGWGLALASVGFDVAGKVDIAFGSPYGGAPGGIWLEVEWLQ